MLIGTTPTPLNLCFITIFFTNIHETFSIHHLMFSSILSFLLIECFHSKMSQIQLLCSFQKGKDLKLEIEMACNHCIKLWSNHIFDSSTIYFYNKF